MNLGEKQDIDAMLKRWPAPPPGGDQDEEQGWERRADATVRAALESRHGAGAPSDLELDALLAAPALAPEPGESAATFPPAAGPPTERKRGSLKEIAARASQSGARLSASGTPLPTSTPIPIAVGRPPRAPMSTPVPGSLPRPTEAGKEDSGVVNLDAVRSAATPAQIAAAEVAKPGHVGLFDDDQTVESAVNPAQQQAPARPTSIAVVAARRNRTGPIAGAAIALLGIAAAFTILHRKPTAEQPAPVVAAAQKVPEAVQAAPSAAPQVTAAPTAVDVASLPSADPQTKQQADPAKVAAAPGTGASTASKEAPPDPKLAAKASPTGKPGDLESEITRAAGPIDKPTEVAPTPEPAAGGLRNQSIPEQPSQGSVQAAIGAVVGSAKACVAGADDISRAMVTFSSSGAVSSVSVSGWAATHGKSGCVEAALKAAKVGPFSKASFSVPVPIRP